MTTIYFGELIVSVLDEYEDVIEDICNAEMKKEKFIELNEFHRIYEEGNARWKTTSRKIFVRIDSIQYVKE